MTPLTSPRRSCALQGALRSAGAVPGVLPVVHATAGCSLQTYLSGCLACGAQGAGGQGGLSVPSTNVSEKHVVFGGASRLREQLKNTVRVLDADLFLVLSGCAPDLVGDDSAAMTQEIAEQGHRAVYLSAPGFSGDARSGHARLVDTLLDAVAPPPEQPVDVRPGLVNLFGLVPGQDLFWQGDLRRLAEALAQVGVQAQTLFGVGQGLAAWEAAPHAQLNVSVSRWGDPSVRGAQERFGTPALTWPFVPVGALDTAAFVSAVVDRLAEYPRPAVDAWAERVLAEEDEFLDAITDAYVEYGLQSDVVVVGPAAQVVGLVRFLVPALGFTPVGLALTDVHDQAGAEAAAVGLSGVVDDLAVFTRGARPPRHGVPVLVGDDAVAIGALIADSGADLVLGSQGERRAAVRAGAAFLGVSAPVTDRLVVDQSYAGVRGGIALIADVGSVLLQAGARRPGVASTA